MAAVLSDREREWRNQGAICYKIEKKIIKYVKKDVDLSHKT